MRLTMIFILMFFSQWSFAQDFIRIAATISDRTSKSPLPFASIGVIGKSIGTVSNDQGAFEFFVPMELKQDSLFVSYLGYKTYKDRISNIARVEKIEMEEAPVLLNDVIVSGDGAKKLVLAALAAFPNTLPSEPYLMEGFHRSWEKVAYADSITLPGTLIEAAVTIYDPGFSPKGKTREKIFVNEIRRSRLKEHWNYDANFLGILLQDNLVRHYKDKKPAFRHFRSFLNFPNDYVYEWEGTTQLNGESLSVIRMEIPNPLQFPAYFRVYISETDHAILRFDLLGSKSRVDYSHGPWHTEFLDQTYIFNRHEGKMYLTLVKLRYQIKKLDVEKMKVIQTEDYFRMLLVNNLISEGVEERLKILGTASKQNSLALEGRKYNEDFWKTYNVIKDNPLDRDLLPFFEQDERLQNQFKNAEKESRKAIKKDPR